MRVGSDYLHFAWEMRGCQVNARAGSKGCKLGSYGYNQNAIIKKLDYMPFRCKNCGARLIETSEPDDHDWFILCLACGANNVVTAALQILGWRE